MADIAAGKGPGPKPFILATTNQGAPDAIWNSNRASAEELRATEAVSQKPTRTAERSKELPRKPESHVFHLMGKA